MAGADESRGSAEQSQAGTIGFNLGTFLGAFLVALLGGASLSVALFVALIVRALAARTKKRRGGRAIRPIAALGFLVAIVLAVTSGPSFNEDRAAVAKLAKGREAIDRGELVTAMRALASAELLNEESVSISVLSACVTWNLGFYDYALFEAQHALNIGYRPGEVSHYKGRGCFLDVPGYRSFDFLKIPYMGWVLYPLPDGDDAVSQHYLELASGAAEPRVGDRLVALGCLADRYDMRTLAAYMFSVGLNSNYRLNVGKTPFRALLRCLRAKSIRDAYTFRADPVTGYDVFRPVDWLERIPAPSRHEPPDRCWARLPERKPCNSHG